MAFPNANKPWCFYRLGPIKEKELFKHQRDTFDGVIVPAHIASYYSKSCLEFIGALRKPYFIDPMTYVFGNDLSQIKRFIKDKGTGKTERDEYGKKRKGDLKRSFAKLIEVDYKGVIKLVVDSSRPLSPEDFIKTSVREEFVNNVLEFQLSRLSEIPLKYKKYEKYAKTASSTNPPMCVLAPYFPIKSTGSRSWYLTNVEFIKMAKASCKDIYVFAVILASLKLLDNDIEQISNDYLKAGADGLILWPDGISASPTLTELISYFKIVKTLSSSGMPLFIMYGDAFAMVLHFAGLWGFASGICYAERKSSEADIDIEGGPPTRYYISGLKKKIQIDPEAKRIQIENYPALRCDCMMCQRKPDPDSLEDTEAREHFMLARLEEIQMLRNGLKQKEYAALLEAAYESHKDDPIWGSIKHLSNWAAVLK